MDIIQQKKCRHSKIITHISSDLKWARQGRNGCRRWCSSVLLHRASIADVMLPRVCSCQTHITHTEEYSFFFTGTEKYGFRLFEAESEWVKQLRIFLAWDIRRVGTSWLWLVLDWLIGWYRVSGIGYPTELRELRISLVKDPKSRYFFGVDHLSPTQQLKSFSGFPALRS